MSAPDDPRNDSVVPLRSGSAEALSSSSPALAPRKKSNLMLWVGAAFLLLGLAWTALFIAASRHPVATVPLQNQSAKP